MKQTGGVSSLIVLVVLHADYRYFGNTMLFMWLEQFTWMKGGIHWRASPHPRWHGWNQTARSCRTTDGRLSMGIEIHKYWTNRFQVYFGRNFKLVSGHANSNGKHHKHQKWLRHPWTTHGPFSINWLPNCNSLQLRNSREIMDRPRTNLFVHFVTQMI